MVNRWSLWRRRTRSWQRISRRIWMRLVSKAQILLWRSCVVRVMEVRRARVAQQNTNWSLGTAPKDKSEHLSAAEDTAASAARNEYDFWVGYLPIAVMVYGARCCLSATETKLALLKDSLPVVRQNWPLPSDPSYAACVLSPSLSTSFLELSTTVVASSLLPQPEYRSSTTTPAQPMRATLLGISVEILLNILR